MYQTKNDIQEKTRKTVVGILQTRLSMAIDLMQQAKQAHWNVKGANFLTLHQLFDKVYEESGDYADLLAERIVQLGGVAEGTCEAVARGTSLPKYSLTITDEKDHIHALSSALATFGEQIRTAIDEADKLGDKGTADIFTEISRGTDKSLWFVEAHSQTATDFQRNHKLHENPSVRSFK